MTLHFELSGKTVRTSERQEEEEKVLGRMGTVTRIMKPP